MKETVTAEKVQAAVLQFVAWLERHGETSFDHQSYFASDLGRSAKALYYRKPLLGVLAVSPMILSEAFVPRPDDCSGNRSGFPSRMRTTPWASPSSLRFSGKNRTSSTLFIFSKCSRRHVVGLQPLRLGLPIQLGNTQRNP